MKYLLVILGLVFLVSCGKIHNDAENVQLHDDDIAVTAKDCAGNHPNILVKKGTKVIVVNAESHHDDVKIVFGDTKTWVMGDCLLKRMPSLTTEPTSNKYDVIKEYREFEKLCKRYNELVKQNRYVGVDKNELACMTETKSMGYDLLSDRVAAIEFYIKANKK